MSRRPSIWKQIIRAIAFAILASITLLVLAASWISYQGRLDWARTKAELLAKGEKLTQIELAPPPVADKDNFFADSIWKREPNSPGAKLKPSPIEKLDTPLTPAEAATFQKLLPDGGDFATADRVEASYWIVCNYRGYLSLDENRDRVAFLIQLLTPLHPAMDRIQELFDRPAARWPYEYGRYVFATSRFDPYPGILPLAKALSAEAALSSMEGDAHTASEDLISLLKLGETLKDDPLIYALMIRSTVLSMALGIIGTDLRLRVWSDAEILRIQNALQPIDLVAGGALALRGERGLSNQVIEAVSQNPSLWRDSWFWRGYFRPPDSASSKFSNEAEQVLAQIDSALFGAGDQATLNRLVQCLAEIFDAIPLKGFNAKEFERELHRPRNRLERITHPKTDQFIYYYAGNLHILVRLQIEVEQAFMACALERYRLRYKCYPETLDALVPEFIQKLPKDVYTAKPYQYRPETPDRFRLWSVGPLSGDGNGDIIWGR